MFVCRVIGVIVHDFIVLEFTVYIGCGFEFLKFGFLYEDDMWACL